MRTKFYLFLAILVGLLLTACDDLPPGAVNEMSQREVADAMQFCEDLGLKGQIIYDQDTFIITQVICLNDFEFCAEQP